jgi:hypothetical protein
MADILDIFAGDLFKMASLTTTINHDAYKPDLIGGMGLFEEEGVASRNVVIEEDGNSLKLVPTAPWGGVPASRENGKRKGRPFLVPHLPIRDSITAEEVQGVRAYATGMTPAQTLMSVQALRDRKLNNMRNDLEATLEYHRVGAIKGLVLDSDGSSVIYDLFDQFEVSQQTHGMNLDDSTTDVNTQIREAIRKSLNALKNQPVSGFAALCGDQFFDLLIGNAQVRALYLNWQAAADLRGDHRAFGMFDYSGVRWINYRGSVGGVDFVETGKASLFPLGARGLFKGYFGPSDYIDRVNQIPDPNGAPIESRAEMKPMGKGVDLEAQSNPLYLCTKPAAVVLLDATESAS